MIEVLKQMYQLLLTEPHAPAVCDQLEVILRQAIAELESQEPVEDVVAYHADGTRTVRIAPQRTEQEPCGWQFYQDGKWHNGMETNNHRANTESAGIPVRDVYSAPQLTEQNFCSRCGKRTKDLTHIHTCTPPQD
jgi:hypothetical protein